MFSDPVNFIDPNGEFALNIVSAVVGAYLGYDSVASKDACASTASKIKGALIGGLTSLVGLSALDKIFNKSKYVVVGLINFTGNALSQTNDPSYNGDIDWSQAVASGVIGATGGFGNLPKPKSSTTVGNMLYLGREEKAQELNTVLVGSL